MSGAERLCERSGQAVHVSRDATAIRFPPWPILGGVRLCNARLRDCEGDAVAGRAEVAPASPAPTERDTNSDVVDISDEALAQLANPAPAIHTVPEVMPICAEVTGDPGHELGRATMGMGLAERRTLWEYGLRGSRGDGRL